MTGNDNTSGPNTPPRNPWGRPQEQGGWNKGAPRSPQGSDLEDMLSHARNLFGNGADGPRAILMGALAIAVLWAASGIFRLEPGENAVIQRFGAISRTQEEPELG